MDAANSPAKPKHTWWWVVALIAFGALGFYLTAPDIAVLRGALARLREVPIATIAIVVGGAIGLVITEALRIAAIGRIVGTRVRLRDAWDAAVANHVMTAVTPQVGLGEPTVAYTLAKRGTPWDAAVAIPFVKFTTSLALVFILGTVLVATGHGPPAKQWTTSTGVVWFGAIALVALLALAFVSSERVASRRIADFAAWARRRVSRATWIAKIDRAEDVVQRMVARLARLRRGEAAHNGSDTDARDERVADDRARDPRAADERVADDRAPDTRAADDRARDPRAADERVADDRARDPRAADERVADDRAREPRAADERVADDRARDTRAADDRARDPRAADGPARLMSPASAIARLLVVHLVYYASYIAPLVGLALVLGDPPFVELCLRALVYLCFVFAMPTPGGAGPSEAAGAWFFGDLVAPADAIAIVVVFRASTFYLQLAIGALYLPIRKVAR